MPFPIPISPRHVLGGALLGLAALTGVACDEKLSTITGPTPNLSVTFASIQRDIFSAPDSSGRPACTSCHSDQFARFNGGLSLQTNAFANLVNAPVLGKRGAVRVVPGDADASYLIQKLEGRGSIVGGRMPLGGPYLSAGQIAVIRRWIELGAQND